MRILLSVFLIGCLTFGFWSLRSVSEAKPGGELSATVAFDGVDLTPLEVKVTQHDGTEPPFRNTYWDNKVEGIYVCLISGTPLFSSQDKYKSGTGWPSFTKPISPGVLIENTDYLLGYPRTEIRSKAGESHLGHVFKDGPAPTGLRYCMNSAALRFVAKDELESKGYAEFLQSFK